VLEEKDEVDEGGAGMAVTGGGAEEGGPRIPCSDQSMVRSRVRREKQEGLQQRLCTVFREL